MRTSKLIDGVVWDGRDPKKYAGGFKVTGLSHHAKAKPDWRLK